MTQPIVVTLYDQAAQVRWIMHAACAATFTLAMSVLAVRLRRPVMRTIAVVWWWQLVIALNLVAYFYWRSWFADHLTIRVLGTFALHLPSFAMAPLLRRVRAAVVTGEEPSGDDSPHFARWAALSVVTTVLFEVAREMFPAAASTLTFIVSRAVAAVPYLYALYPLPESTPRNATRDTRLIDNAMLLAVGIRAMALAIDLVVRLTPWSDAYADALTVFVVTSNLVALVAFGTILLFVALENERTATMRQAAALHAAELREAHSQRFLSLGRLAGGVAHDFNNVLTVVLSTTEEARHLTDDARVHAELEAIASAGRQGTALTRQLLDYARPRPAALHDVAPAEVIRGMVPILERMLGTGRRLACDVQTEARLHMNASQLEQVVMNLVVNARDAMVARGGTVTVTLADVDVTPSTRQPTALAPGRYVRLAVADTGCGIPEALLPSIFDPFVTTKESQGGTGLGLATVQEIARAHGGDVFVESTVDVGTTVAVWIPVAHASRVLVHQPV